VIQLGQALAGQLEGGCKDVVPVNFGTGAPVGIVSTNCVEMMMKNVLNAPTPTVPTVPAMMPPKTR
jgi:hypothetical protein